MGMGRFLAHGRPARVVQAILDRLLGTPRRDQRRGMDETAQPGEEEESVVRSH